MGKVSTQLLLQCPVLTVQCPPHSASPGVNDFYLWRKTLLSCVVLRLPFYTEVLLVRTFLNYGATSFFFLSLQRLG